MTIQRPEPPPSPLIAVPNAAAAPAAPGGANVSSTTPVLSTTLAASPGDERRPRPAVRSAVVVAVMALIAWYYAWTAGTNGTPLIVPPGTMFTAHDDEICANHYGYYNLLADAYLAGQLSLLVEPPKELLALSDPYDPKQNKPYRLHDATLFNGKYYLYFGPTPALLLFIPWRLLGLVGVGHVSEPLATAIFAFGAYAFSVLLLRHLVRRHLPKTPFWMELTGVVCLGLSNTMPFILRRPVVYEVAITCGAMLSMGGLYFLIRGYEGWRRPLSFSLASLMFGLAIGARPNLVLSVLLLAAIGLLILKNEYHRRVFAAWREATALAAPFCACLALVLAYNFARFEKASEFGLIYQLAGTKVSTIALLGFSNIVPNAYFYFLAPPRLHFLFPYVRLAKDFPGAVPATYLGVEPVAGLFIVAPISLCVLFFPWLLGRGWRRRGDFFVAMCSLVGTGIAIAFFVSLIIPAATMRYEGDFVMPLLLAAVLLWICSASVVTTQRARIRLNMFVAAAVAFGCIFNLAIGMLGYFQLFERGEPGTYAAIERMFLPVTNFLGRVASAPSRIRLFVCPANQFDDELGSPVYRIDEQPAVVKAYFQESAALSIRALWNQVPSSLTDGPKVVRLSVNGHSFGDFTVCDPAEHDITIPLAAGLNLVTVSVDDGSRSSAHPAVECRNLRIASETLPSH